MQCSPEPLEQRTVDTQTDGDDDVELLRDLLADPLDRVEADGDHGPCLLELEAHRARVNSIAAGLMDALLSVAMGQRTAARDSTRSLAVVELIAFDV